MFGRTMTDGGMEMYLAALNPMTADEVEAAVRRLAATAKFMPPPSELLEGPGFQEIKPSDRAALAFEALSSSVAAVGYYRSPDFDDRLINAAVRMLGGWERICEMPSEEFDKWFRKDFIATYETLSRTGVSDELAQPLVGFCERENAISCRGHIHALEWTQSRDRVEVATGLPWAGDAPKRLNDSGQRKKAPLPRLELKKP
jgi:hypothetical protein